MREEEEKGFIEEFHQKVHRRSPVEASSKEPSVQKHPPPSSLVPQADTVKVR